MNNEWLKKFTRWNAISKFILDIRVLWIVVAVTVIVVLIGLVFGGMLSGISAASGDEIRWLLTIGIVFWNLLIIEACILVSLLLMKLPLFINNMIESIKIDWADMKNDYNRKFKKDNDE